VSRFNCWTACWLQVLCSQGLDSCFSMQRCFST
jgi:hypothetical protein